MLRFILTLLAFRTSTAAAPLSLHILKECDVAGDVDVPLTGYDLDGDTLIATVTSLPSTGKLYQLSDVYSKYGVEYSKSGTQIKSVPTNVTGSQNRIVYVRPKPDRTPSEEFDRFEYTVSDATQTSVAGTVTIVGSDRLLIASNFDSNSESWTTSGNTANGVTFEATSKGLLMNHYIYATDDTLNIDSVGATDKNIWHFLAPSKFSGWQGVVYGGTMEFTLSSFSGDYTTSNLNENQNLVELYCQKCYGNTGVTMGFPMSAATFDGTTKTFTIPMLETSGWLRDPESSIKAWNTPTRCNFIEVLSGLTSVKILGDYTKWYESVSLDSVNFRAGGKKSLIPICAQGAPDANLNDCSCT